MIQFGVPEFIAVGAILIGAAYILESAISFSESGGGRGGSPSTPNTPAPSSPGAPSAMAYNVFGTAHAAEYNAQSPISGVESGNSDATQTRAYRRLFDHELHEIIKQNPLPGATINEKSGATADGKFDPSGALRGGRRHMGLDLATDVGTEVMAAADGRAIVVNDPDGMSTQSRNFLFCAR